MSERTLYERVVDHGGHKYIRLKTGRLVGYFETRASAVGMGCAMPQPSGLGCDGIMVATATWWRGAYSGTEGKP